MIGRRGVEKKAVDRHDLFYAIFLFPVLIPIGAIFARRRNRRCRPSDQTSHSNLAGQSNVFILTILGLSGVAFLGIILWQTWRWTQWYTEQTAKQQAQLAVEFQEQLRNYVAEHVRPEMKKRAGPHEFIPETMSTSFVARNVFEGIRKKFPDYLLRFPTTNPRNPANAATESEKKIIQYFQEHPESESWDGTIEFEGKQYYVHALPRRFEKNCLTCHGVPADAPSDLLEHYGADSGFHHSPGDVSLDLVGVRMDDDLGEIRAQAYRHFFGVGGLCGVFLVTIALFVYLDSRRRKGMGQILLRNNQKLREMNRQFEHVLTATKTGFGIIDHDCNLHHVTRHGRSVYGDPGKCKCCEYFMGRKNSCEDCEIGLAIKTRQAAVTEISLPLENNRIFEMHIVPFETSEGEPRIALFGIDITEHKTAEQMVRDSEARLDSIINTASDGIVMLNAEGNISMWNKSAAKLFGYSAPEVTGSNFFKLLIPDCKQQSHLMDFIEFQRVHENKGTYRSLELSAARKNGEKISVEMTLSAMQLHEDWYAIGILRDISVRKYLERELWKRNEQFTLAVQGSQDGIWDWDLLTDTIYLSPRWKEMIGYQDAELPNEFSVFEDRLHPDDKQRVLDCMNRYLRGEVPEYCTEFRFRHKDGRYRWILARGKAIRNEQGKPYRIAGSHSDITDRKQAEEKLRENSRRLARERSKLQTLFNATQMGMLLVNEKLKVVDINEAAAQLVEQKSSDVSLGCSPGETLCCIYAKKEPGGCGKSKACEQCAIREMVKQVLRTGKNARNVEINHKLAIGEQEREFWFSISGSAVEIEGQRHVLLAVADITCLKKTEEELRNYATALEEANRDAEIATRTKSEFLANMSHEIRTPMTAILGYTDILAGTLREPEQVEAVRIIHRNGEHLLAIINDILDLSKVEAGKIRVEHIPCSPTAILNDVAALMRTRAVGKGIELKIDMVGSYPETIATDPVRLRQILVNLVGNAIKFTDFGEVRVTAALVDTDTARPKMQFEVADTGIGMTLEQLEKLFQPFHQADTSTTRKFGGTGLGLVISKRLAELLGGDIAVQSRPGEGSTFTVTIDTGSLKNVRLLDRPFEQAVTPTVDSNSLSQDVQPLQNRRILLAEDGPDNQRLISFLLRKAGAEVTVVEDGRKAMEAALAAGTEPFDVILMDMQMPIMDGYEATRRLRDEGYTGPIIALTAHAMIESRRKCLDAGCDDYLTKPIDRTTFLPAIAERLKSTAVPAETILEAAGDGAYHRPS